MKLRKFICNTFLWVLLSPYALITAGAASNQLVLIANHDKFPVMVNTTKLPKLADVEGAPDGMLDDVHCVMTNKTHLNFLADIFDMHDAVYSIGDFALGAGEWLNIFCPFVWGALIVRKCWEADAV